MTRCDVQQAMRAGVGTDTDRDELSDLSLEVNCQYERVKLEVNTCYRSSCISISRCSPRCPSPYAMSATPLDIISVYVCLTQRRCSVRRSQFLHGDHKSNKRRNYIHRSQSMPICSLCERSTCQLTSCKHSISAYVHRIHYDYCWSRTID